MNHQFIVLLKVILTISFLVCLLDMPYSYYQIVRFMGMVIFGILAYTEYQQKRLWFIIWLASALLINPFIKITLGRELWNVVDVIWAILLISSIFLTSAKSRGS